MQQVRGSNHFTSQVSEARRENGASEPDFSGHHLNPHHLLWLLWVSMLYNKDIKKSKEMGRKGT